MKNECIPFYEPAAQVTGHPTAAVTGKRFVKVSGNRSGGNVAVAHADAAGRVFGVAGWDAAIAAKVTILRGPGLVVPVKAVGAIAAFGEIEVGANGQATAKAAGVAVGYALTAAADTEDVQCVLY